MNHVEWESHKQDALIENAEFLFECGEQFDQIARRLGISQSWLEKLMERSDRGDSDSAVRVRGGKRWRCFRDRSV